MKCILQIFTGGFEQTQYQAEEIIGKIQEIQQEVSVHAVIIGWSKEKESYRTVGNYLKQEQIPMLLWMPVFSELEELGKTKLCVDLWGNQIALYQLQEGESFCFACPTTKENKELVWDNYTNHMEECGFDGVFLDKIRTQSFVSGVHSIVSCGCPSCVDKLTQYGADVEEWKALIEEKGMDEAFEVVDFSHQKGYTFRYPQAARFFEAKGRVLAEEINELVQRFQAKGKLVGLDVYAPFLTQFVGQNLAELSRCADFIKPMMYRKTQAPAGMPFEYNCLRKSLPKACGYQDLEFDRDFLKKEIEAMQANTRCAIYPGIEVNYREDIAKTNPSYLRESMEVLQECGVEGCVLSWNMMQAPAEHISCVAKYMTR